MNVSEIMATDLQVVTQDSTVGDAVLVLTEEHITGLPVVDSKGGLVGVLSTTDVLQATAEKDDAEAREELFRDTQVAEIMTPRPETVSPGTDVREASARMLSLEVHRLFVEDNGRLVGVISQTDVVRAVAKEGI